MPSKSAPSLRLSGRDAILQRSCTTRQDICWDARAAGDARSRRAGALCTQPWTPAASLPESRRAPTNPPASKLERDAASWFTRACSLPCLPRGESMACVPSTASEASAPLARAPTLSVPPANFSCAGGARRCVYRTHVPTSHRSGSRPPRSSPAQDLLRLHGPARCHALHGARIHCHVLGEQLCSA